MIIGVNRVKLRIILINIICMTLAAGIQKRIVIFTFYKNIKIIYYIYFVFNKYLLPS